MTDEIRPFELAVPESVLADLKSRIANTPWPEKETVSDWSQGAPLAKVHALVDHWQHRYDWRRCERVLNEFGQYKTTIDGLDIHFLHIKSPVANAFPLIITHGWPGSVMEFHKIIRPLVDPVAHGGEARDAFDLVVHSLPGYGFSERPSATGWIQSASQGRGQSLCKGLVTRAMVLKAEIGRRLSRPIWAIKRRRGLQEFTLMYRCACPVAILPT